MYKRIIALILCALIFSTMLGGCSLFTAPTYTATGTFMVNVCSVDGNGGSLDTQMIGTILEITKSEHLKDQILAHSADGNFTYEVEHIKNTNVFRVSVTSVNSKLAADACNGILDILPHMISEIIEGSSVKVIDTAKVPANPD